MTRCQCWRNQQGRGQAECSTPVACRILADTDRTAVSTCAYRSVEPLEYYDSREHRHDTLTRLREDDGMGCIRGVIWAIGITGGVIFACLLIVHLALRFA